MTKIIPADKAPGLPAKLPPFGLAEEILKPPASPMVQGQPGTSLLDFLQTLPRAEERAEAADPPVRLVSIELARELYGIDIRIVQEVIRVGTITRVPGAPSPIQGITSLRGKILPVLDLRSRLGLPQAQVQTRSRIVVVEIGGRHLGLLVDAVQQVLALAASGIEPPPEGGELLGGVAHLPDGRLIILLELDRLLERA